MRRRLGREIFWLSLPVVLLAGVALYKTRGGRLPASKLLSALDNGPRRLEFSFQSIKLTPFDVYSGYSWGIKTNVWETGKLDVPSSWKEQKLGIGGPEMRLVYRRGTEWKQLNMKKSPFGLWLSGDSVTIKVRLEDVPHDAEEVRLRGRFLHDEVYRGAIPQGWISPVKVKHAGLNHFFPISSETFDIPIAEEGRKWPAPLVSQQQKMEVIEGRWLVDTVGRNEWLLRVRARADSDLQGKLSCAVNDLRYFDAGGKPLAVYQDATSTVTSSPQGSMRGYTNYEIPPNENIVRLAQPSAQPRGGWGKVKMPITITGIVSDGECWPTPFKVRVAPEQGEPRDYGAPPQTTKAPRA